MNNFLPFLFLFILCTAFANTSHAQDSEFHLDETYSISPTGTISLHSSDAKVHVIGSNRTSVHVKIDRTVDIDGFSWGDNDFNVEVIETDGDLKIREKSEGSYTIMGSLTEKYEIWIEAPVGVSLAFEGDDDHYYIQDINGALSLSIDDGDAELVNCNGDKFDFKLDDGSIIADKAKGQLNLTADDAEVKIENASFNKIYAQLDDSEFYLETSIPEKGKYEFFGDDSDFELVVISGGGRFEVNHDNGRTNVSGAFKIVSEDENQTILSLNDGTADIIFDNDDAAVRLTTL